MADQLAELFTTAFYGKSPVFIMQKQGELLSALLCIANFFRFYGWRKM
jgi:hypothetical protein